MDAATTEAERVDLVFPLSGRSLPRDHRAALWRALAQALAPQLARGELAPPEPHPVNLVPGWDETAWLSGRARLVLRTRRQDVPALQGLAGRDLDVGGHAVRLGPPHARELLPHGTLYAHCVVTAHAEEAAFLQDVADELQQLQARCDCVCGQRQSIRMAAPADPGLSGFSLLLHGLAPAAALRVLQAGLGQHRQLGCGVFVPHKSAAAVGAA
jgi:CRISPR-associated protein Cas6